MIAAKLGRHLKPGDRLAATTPPLTVQATRRTYSAAHVILDCIDAEGRTMQRLVIAERGVPVTVPDGTSREERRRWLQ